MKKSLLLICAGLTLAAVSCKKDDDNKTTTPASRAELLRGTWTVSEWGSDMNNNTTLDANETAPASAAGIAGTQTFNADGTGVVNVSFMGQSVTESFTWSLIDDNNMRFISNGDTSNILIKELTANKVVGLDQSTSPGTWNVLTK